MAIVKKTQFHLFVVNINECICCSRLFVYFYIESFIFVGTLNMLSASYAFMETDKIK